MLWHILCHISFLWYTIYIGLVDGVTTNPSLFAKEGRIFKDVIKEICAIVEGPVSAEVISLDVEGMLKEAHEIAEWAPNVVIKLPMTEAGFIGRLDDIGVDVMLLIRSLRQVLDQYGLASEIIAASIRHIGHFEQAAIGGAHIATIPGALLPALWKHPLTDNGIERFHKDWEKVPKL